MLNEEVAGLLAKVEPDHLPRVSCRNIDLLSCVIFLIWYMYMKCSIHKVNVDMTVPPPPPSLIKKPLNVVGSIFER